MNQQSPLINYEQELLQEEAKDRETLRRIRLDRRARGPMPIFAEIKLFFGRLIQIFLRIGRHFTQSSLCQHERHAEADSERPIRAWHSPRARRSPVQGTAQEWPSCWSITEGPCPSKTRRIGGKGFLKVLHMQRKVRLGPLS